MKSSCLLRRLCLTKRAFKFSLVAIALIFSFGLTAKAAQRQILYAASGTFGVDGVLYTLDANTGAVLTTVGPLNDAGGKNYGMTGLCYDPLNGIFYGASGNPSATNPNYLVTVDPVTAQITPIGPFGAVMTDIALDPTTGIMYGVSGYNQKFYTINLATGLATQTGSTGIGFQNGGGFAANTRGEFYGVSYFSTYSYNKGTGDATLVGPTLLPNLVRAACFNSSNVLYGLEGGGGLDNLHLRFLVTIDVTTGLAVEVGPIEADDLDAMAFVPARRR
ncbi:MAG TPA: hypothetical protein VGL24_13865 [Chthoniobacterales bacterium]